MSNPDGSSELPGCEPLDPAIRFSSSAQRELVEGLLREREHLVDKNTADMRVYGQRFAERVRQRIAEGHTREAAVAGDLIQSAGERLYLIERLADLELTLANILTHLELILSQQPIGSDAPKQDGA